MASALLIGLGCGSAEIGERGNFETADDEDVPGSYLLIELAAIFAGT
jgi:hypothetical protein